MISVELTKGTVEAGSALEGRLVFDEDERGDSTVEFSVLWETSGKGDTDMGVVHFAKVTNRGELAFRVQLPLLPLSYDGTVLTITWLVRVRSGNDVLDEPFTMVALA